MTRPALLLALCSAISAGAAPPDATPTPPATTAVPGVSADVNVTLIQMEVRIEDKKGEFVRGLKKEDLSLTEDGQTRVIEFVDEVSSQDGAPAVLPTPWAPPAGPAAASTPPPPARALASLLVVVDRANSATESLRRQRKHLTTLLDSLSGEDTLVAVVDIGPDGGYRMRSDFSTNLGAARKAIEELAAGSGGGSDRRTKNELLESVLEQKIGQCGYQRATGTSCEDAAFRGLIHTATTFVQEEKSRSTAVMESLHRIIKFTDHLPGSRSLLLISEGLDPDGVSYFNTAAQLLRFYSSQYRFGDSQRYIADIQRQVGLFATDTPRFQELTELAQANNVTLHWVNPAHGGDLGSTHFMEQQLGSYTSSIEVAQAAEPPRLMRAMAEDTGGLAATRAAGLDKFFRRLARDLHTYYLVSYSPGQRPRDGGRHKVEVKTKRPGLTVRMRAAHVEQLPQAQAQRTLASALDFPDLFNTFAVDATVHRLRLARDRYQVRVRLGIPYGQLAPAQVGAEVRGRIHIGWLVRNSAGDLVKAGSPWIDFNDSEANFTRLVREDGRLDYGLGIDLEPGQYTLVTAVVDATNLRSATHSFPLDLPAPGGRCLVASPLLLARQVTGAAETVTELQFDDGGHARWRDQRLIFSTQRLVPASGKLAGLYQVLDAAPGPDGAIQVTQFFRLFQGGRFLNQTPPSETTRLTDPASGTITSFFSVPYSRLAPGDYRLELVVRDQRSGCESVGAADFTVVQAAAAVSEETLGGKRD